MTSAIFKRTIQDQQQNQTTIISNIINIQNFMSIFKKIY